LNIPCNNWLSLPSYQSYAQVGDLDIPGNKVTLEAIFVRTAPYSNGFNWAGDLVSKHVDPSDANYLLRPNNAEITTTNGFFTTPPVCEIQLNKVYHAAMVYDGAVLKFYRNGFLMSSIPATGNLIQNNHQTRIGLYDALFHNTNLIGYINEVRIWNVARTQSEIRAYMNSSLPSPSTQPGLLAYYTFDNLLNKQGNTAWNATLGGSSSANATIPDCNYVADSCSIVVSPASCNNWLTTSFHPSGVTVGDVDITGDKLTVEALFYRSSAFDPTLNFGKLVSKHTDATNVNYSLMPVTCEITTTNGYINTPAVCLPSLDRIYHVAMVYDGATLKFYRNGYLLSSVAWTGNLVNNDLLTTIGNGSTFPFSIYQHMGYLNEVRIWNIARTQNDLRTYLNNSLPNPTTTPGLVAYYTFDNLINKQGNPAWNGTTSGPAIINSIIPNCNYVADSCTARTNISNIINTYTPVIALNPCENKITVEDASTFNPGDTVMLIQMKGAVIDSSNTASFGTITDYKNAGNYEINYVKSKAGNIIELKNTITRSYDIPTGKVQLIRVPYYQNATVTATLTCLPWDGSKGGVLVLNALDTVTLNANIDVSGKGFRGGADPFTNPPSFNCYENQFYYPANPDLASEKGEGIALISPAKSFGKGALANGGGGGNSHNSGGGGGSNAGQAGLGGYNFEGSPCTNTPFDNRGFGGKPLAYSTSANKIFLGGGGGAGHSNNPTAFESTGGNGSGIIIILADKIKTNGNKIMANGNHGTGCGTSGPQCHEGMGGGGGGGAVLIRTNSYIGSTVVEAKGGNGANMSASGFQKVGPGGGGGGGVLSLSNSSLPAAIVLTSIGGTNGVCTGYSNDAFGATPGQNGTTLFNLVVPVDNILFRPNIDSVRIKDSLLTCADFDFKGLAYTNTNPVASWQWYFDDGGTANTQNTTYTFTPGPHLVKLVVTDINGCKDSITTNVTASVLTMDAGPADTICSLNSTTLQATSNGATQYAWTPAAFLDDPTILNPAATPPVTTMFYLTATNATGCTRIDSVLVTVRSATGFSINPPVDMCDKETVQLTASGGDIYNWQPAASLDDPSVFNPVASPGSTTVYTVTITDTLCSNTTNLSTTVTVQPLPAITASSSNDIDCSRPSSQLSASGGSQYTWTPAATLSNPNSASPLARPTITTQYFVTGTSLAGCSNKDSVLVKVSSDNKGGYFMPTGFTPNNDGLNDCFGPKLWGTIQEIEFSVYNRWGGRIFYSKKVGDCWNGTYKGVQQNPDVYVFMIKAKTTCNPSVFRKGTFVLIR